MVETKLTQVPPAPPRDLIKFLHNFSGTNLFAAYHRGIGVEGKPPAQHFHSDIYSSYNYLYELQKSGYEIYFTVNEVKGKERKTENVVRARAVFVDDDIPRKEGYRKDFLLKPSLVVETSEGKYHYYWLTSTTNITEWREVQEALIHLYRTDNKIKDPPRVMRLPSFKHYTGFQTRVVGGNSKMYTWQEITDNYPPLPPEALDPEAPPISSQRTQAEMMRIIVEGKANSGLHDATRDLAWGMLKDGKSAPATIKYLHDLMSGYDLSNARQKENIGIVERTVLSAAKKIRVQGVSAEEREVLPLEKDWSYLLENNIPEDCIPKAMWEAAKEIGDFTCAGEVPAVLAGVVITSALLGKNVLIHEIEDSLLQRCRMGLIIAMHTGTVKTGVYENMCKPFFEYEEMIQKRWEDFRHRHTEEVEALRIRRKKAHDKYKKKNTSTSEEAAMLDELEGISKRIEWLDQPKPSLWMDDSTEERLVAKLFENDGAMAVLSDDARNTIKNIMGRYTSSGSSEGTYICGLTGSTIDSHRQKDGGTDISIKDPVLNLLLFVQPDKATSFKQSEVYLESGLAARIPIYYYPITGEEIIAKRNKVKRRKLDHSKMGSYYKALQSICRRSPHFPLVVKLSESAKKRHADMDKELMDKLEDEWRGHYDKINKISTLVVTYATVFAAIDDPEFAQKLELCESRSDKLINMTAAPEVAIGKMYKINKDEDRGTEIAANITYTLKTMYVNMGWEFAKTLFNQSIESYEELDLHPIIKSSRTILSTIDKLYAKGTITEGFTECSAFGNLLPVTVRKDLGEVLTLLVERGWLVTKMRTQVEGKGKLNGGTPNKVVKPGDMVYELNIKGLGKARRECLKNEMKWGKADVSLLQSLLSGS